MSGNIQQCYNLKDINQVMASNPRYGKGGISGLNNNSGTIKNCYNLGNIDLKGWNIGGIIGQNSGNVEYSYNVGFVSRLGGIVGTNNGMVKNCYIINTLEITSGGSGSVENSLVLTEEQMKLKEKITLDNGHEVTLLELLNSNGVFWQEDEKNQNKGFPILIK